MNVITIESGAFNRLIEMLEQVHDMYKKRNDDLKQMSKTSRTWVDNEEASTLLRVSKRTLLNYRDKGILGYSQIGKQIYYRLEDIEDLLNNHYRKPYKNLKGGRYE